jgi:hypothetical protein
MKKHLTLTAAITMLMAFTAVWAFAQRGHGPWPEDRPGRPRIDRGPRAVPPLSDRQAIDRMTLIDDVDRDAQRKFAAKEAQKPNIVRRIELGPIRRTDLGPAGRYAVAASEQCTVLLDTVTGKTWLLCPPADGNPAGAVWIPTRRIDDPQEACRWVLEQEEQKRKASSSRKTKK